jgi:uncharacterized protein YyaL (SSP411 family)
MTEEHFTNRLIEEKSPYLRQHAHNPVNWYPWGQEAFHVAQIESKPIFLSIGYATCHWCHVMEKESFQNPSIAQAMNDAFVCVKVDREELPEVDNLYMEFAQAIMAGAAGWPLNVVCTPDLKPFYAATYIPPISMGGQIGLEELAQQMHSVWQGEDRQNLLAQADQVIEAFQAQASHLGTHLPPGLVVDNTAQLILGLADPVNGGIKGAPKFPIAYQIILMLRHGILRQDSRALFYVHRTLDGIQRGGIYDQIGGGFARYTVDEQWIVPHFEKMLYDNALNAEAYLEAWQATGQELYRNTCVATCDYLLRVLRAPEGGFYCAQDADSEGREGAFYTWSREEIAEALGNDADLFCSFYDVKADGSFEGRNILHIKERERDFAQSHQIDEEELRESLAAMRARLFEVREKRPHPMTDKKVVVFWNGLAISTLARAGRTLGRQDYLDAAEAAANFIREHLMDGTRLLRRWCDGEARFQATLDDYAGLIRALLDLFSAGCGTEWLEWALQLSAMLSQGHKAEDGAFYMTAEGQEHIVLRRCHYADGAEPSGNAIHSENLLRLHAITGEAHYLHEAEDVMRGVSRFIENYPAGYCYHLLALQRYYDEERRTVLVNLDADEKHAEEIRNCIDSSYAPHADVIWVKADDTRLRQLLGQRQEQLKELSESTVFLCYPGACQEPMTDLEQIKQALDRL